MQKRRSKSFHQPGQRRDWTRAPYCGSAPGFGTLIVVVNLSLLSVGLGSPESCTSVAGRRQKPISKLKSFMKEQHCISDDPNFTKFPYFQVKNCGVFSRFYTKASCLHTKAQMGENPALPPGIRSNDKQQLWFRILCLMSFVKLFQLQFSAVVQVLPFPAEVNSRGIKFPVNGEYLNASIHELDFHPIIPPI